MELFRYTTFRSWMKPDACAADGTAHMDRHSRRHEKRAPNGGRHRVGCRLGLSFFLHVAAQVLVLENVKASIGNSA